MVRLWSRAWLATAAPRRFSAFSVLLLCSLHFALALTAVVVNTIKRSRNGEFIFQEHRQFPPPDISQGMPRLIFYMGQRTHTPSLEKGQCRMFLANFEINKSLKCITYGVPIFRMQFNDWVLKYTRNGDSWDVFCGHTGNKVPVFFYVFMFKKGKCKYLIGCIAKTYKTNDSRVNN